MMMMMPHMTNQSIAFNPKINSFLFTISNRNSMNMRFQLKAASERARVCVVMLIKFCSAADASLRSGCFELHARLHRSQAIQTSPNFRLVAEED